MPQHGRANEPLQPPILLSLRCHSGIHRVMALPLQRLKSNRCRLGVFDRASELKALDGKAIEVGVQW